MKNGGLWEREPAASFQALDDVRPDVLPFFDGGELVEGSKDEDGEDKVEALPARSEHAGHANAACEARERCRVPSHRAENSAAHGRISCIGKRAMAETGVQLAEDGGRGKRPRDVSRNG